MSPRQGNDTLYGEVGNDYLYGEDGNDTMILLGDRGDYNISLNEQILTIKGVEGTDTVLGIENFQFADETYTLEELMTII